MSIKFSMELPRTRNSREVQFHFVGITINHHGLQKRSQESFKSHHLFNGNQSWTIKMYKFFFFFFFCSPPVQKFKQSSFFLHPNPKEIPCKNVPAPLCALSGGRDRSEPGWPSWMLAAKHKKIHFRNHFFPQKNSKKGQKNFQC